MAVQWRGDVQSLTTKSALADVVYLIVFLSCVLYSILWLDTRSSNARIDPGGLTVGVIVSNSSYVVGCREGLA